VLTRRHTILLAMLILLAAALACNAPLPGRSEDSPTVTPYQPGPVEETAVPIEPSATPEPDPTPEPSTTPTPEPAPIPILRVVYTNEGRLWIAEGETPARALTTGPGDSMPILSPDGRWVVYRHEVPPGPSELPRFELRLIGSDGTRERALLPVDELPGEMGAPIESEVLVLLDRLPFQVVWFPDSSAIAFNTQIEHGYGLATRDDLWRVDLETGALARLLDDGQGGAFAFSPDGETIAAAGTAAVAIVRSDGSERRTAVTFDRVNTASEYAYMPQPVWAPDGSHALVAISSPEPFGPDPTTTVWRIPVAGAAAELATLPGDFLFLSMSTGMWSADRTQLAYTLLADWSSAVDELIVANVDGSEATTYTSGNTEFLSWSPEGQRFAYVQDMRSSAFIGQLGADPVPLVMPGTDARLMTLHWAGADTVIYTVAEGRDFSIWLQTLDGASREIASGSGAYPDVDVSWNDIAGELGHTTIDVNGPRCSCGNYGCRGCIQLQAAVVERARRALSYGQRSSILEIAAGDADAVTLSMVIEAALAENHLAEQILEETARYLAVGAVNAINLFDPEAVFVGREISLAGDLILDPIRQIVAERAFSVAAERVKVLPACLKADAPVIGATVLVLQELFSAPAGPGGTHGNVR